MKKLNTKARTTEVDALAGAIERAWDEAKDKLTADTYLTTCIATLTELSSNLTEAIKRTKVLSELEDKDTERDDIIRAIDCMLISYSLFPDTTKAEAAKVLYKLFSKYGKAIVYESYIRETSYINSLLRDFTGSDAVIALAELPDVQTLIAELSTRQNTYIAAHDAFVAAGIAEKNALSATELKRQLISLINGKLISYLTLMLDSNAPLYSDFVAKVEAEITRINTTISARQTSSTSDTESENSAT